MNRRQLIAVASASAIVRPRPALAASEKHLLVAGQSLALQWDVYPAAFGAFMETRQVMGDDSAWTLTVAAEGGSTLLKEHAPLAYPDRYWWDYANLCAGPVLTRALTKIAGLTFTHAVWIHGQTDAVRWSPANYGPAALKLFYRKSFNQVAPRIFPAGKMHLNVLEYRTTPPLGDPHIREAHRELIELGHALQGAEPNADMVKLDGLHPSPVAGYADLGVRVARAIAV